MAVNLKITDWETRWKSLSEGKKISVWAPFSFPYYILHFACSLETLKMILKTTAPFIAV